MENKLDNVLSLLANNSAFYQQLIDAVESEAIAAKDKLSASAIQALYHPESVPQACGQGGVYQAWSDLLIRLRKFQHK